MAPNKKKLDWLTDLRGIAGGAGALLGVGFIIVICFAGEACALPLMAGMACMGSGAVVGFLFGIPKTLQGNQNKNGGQTPGKQQQAGPGDAENDSRVEDNTNLEQISDWLTKILIGASLVQFRQLITFFQHVAQRLADDMPSGARSESFAVFLMVYFLVVGFVAGYLFTRLYLKGAMNRADALKLQAICDIEPLVPK
jgi:hypothetical protein